MQINDAKIVNSNIAIIFEPMKNARRNIFHIEEIFKEKYPEKFLTPQIPPIPDEAPGEIPRLIFTSKHGHSTLNITLNRADLATNYDENFNSDIQKCFTYIREKSDYLNDILNIAEVKPLFSSFTLLFRWSYEDIEPNSLIPIVKDKFLHTNFQNEDLFDFKVIQAIIYGESFYINNTVNNYRLFRSNAPIVSIYPPLKDLVLKEYGLELNIEINDRLGYNNGIESKGLFNLEQYFEILEREMHKHEAIIRG